MPIDPQDGIDDWIPIGNARGSADHPDDWIALGNARGDNDPDDWIALSAPATPSMPPPTPRPQPIAPSPGISSRPAPPPDPFTASWPRIPASSLTEFAWAPPIFPNAQGQYPRPAPEPLPNPPIGGYGLLGGLANLQPANTDSPLSGLGLLGGLASRPSNQLPGLLGGLATLSWSAPPAASGGVGDYPGLGREPAGSNAEAAARYGPSSPSYILPDPIGDEVSGPSYADILNDSLNRADPTGLVSDQLRTHQAPDVALGTSPENASQKILLAGGEGWDTEDEEQKKFETPEVTAGLTEPGLKSPKRLPRLPSIPPLEVQPTLPPPNVATRPGGRGVWDSPPTIRGRVLEQLFGHNLHPNNPTVDIWDRGSGTVTSLKSIDLDSPAYRVEGNSQNSLYNRLSKCVNDLAEFQGSYYTDTIIPEEAIKSRTLTVIVPSDGTAAQQEVMRRIVELGKQRGVSVNIKTYP